MIYCTKPLFVKSSRETIVKFKYIDGKKIDLDVNNFNYIKEETLEELPEQPLEEPLEEPLEGPLEELPEETLEEIMQQEPPSYDDNFLRYMVHAEKLEKITGKFVRNPNYANVQIAVDCENAEFIDHEIAITLNENVHYGTKKLVKVKEKFQILKLKNLLIKSFDQGPDSNKNLVQDNDYPTRVVSGKKFVVLAFDAIYHGCTEFYGQFEILNNFDNEIKPFFVFGKHDHHYHKDIFEIYKKEFDLNDLDIFTNGKENVILEEVYIIYDTNAFISENIDKKFNLVKIIPEGPMSGIAMYYRAGKEMAKQSIDRDEKFPFKLPDWQTFRFGLTLMAERHRKYIAEYDERIDVLYISRENYSNSFYQSLQKTLEEETVNPKNFFIQCQTYFNRTILDEDKLIDLLKASLQKRGKQIKKVFFEELNYIDQISLVKNSNTIISLQGSGLCNVLFADKESKIIEICHPFDDSKFRHFYNPISIDEPEKHVNYMKSGNWYSMLYNDWKYESVETLENEEII